MVRVSDLKKIIRELGLNNDYFYYFIKQVYFYTKMAADLKDVGKMV